MSASVIANASSGAFAPYLLSSLGHGKVTQKSSLLGDISVAKDMDGDARFSWGFGAEILAGMSTDNDYQIWNQPDSRWTGRSCGQSSLWLQQLYGEIKYRSLTVSAGLKERGPLLLNPELSSGDFVESGNSRPIPEVRAGFYDFTTIPLTRGWLQIMVQLGFGRTTDYGFMSERYNRYNYHINKGALYNYKCCMFRTNPEERLSVTLGMQSAAFFGGTTTYYRGGEYEKTEHFKSDAWSFVQIAIPIFGSGGEEFYTGSSLGSWDLYASYTLDNGSEVSGYFQWPFEDGSGIARRNGSDGIWGVEFRSNRKSIVSGVVAEYIDFRNQSGPIHYAPGDFTNPTLTTNTSGKDDYYNNAFYNSYAYYGMSIGTPFLLSPIYNLDGYPAFACNRTNGFHLGVKGYISQRVIYKILASHQHGLGTYDVPYPSPRDNTSWMAEVQYDVNSSFGIRASMGMDRGQLRGDNTGALLVLTYRGDMKNLFKR